MAFFDWNKDGKIDMQDDFIEYNSYKQSTENNSKNNYNSSGGIPNFGAIKPKTITKSSSSKKKSDPYNVYDYSDPEDFYYDNYDDFWDYEDAEDDFN